MRKIDLNEFRSTVHEDAEKKNYQHLESKLQSCRHCGGRPRVRSCNVVLERVICSKCGMMTPACVKVEEAVAVWEGNKKQ